MSPKNKVFLYAYAIFLLFISGSIATKLSAQTVPSGCISAFRDVRLSQLARKFVHMSDTEQMNLIKILETQLPPLIQNGVHVGFRVQDLKNLIKYFRDVKSDVPGVSEGVNWPVTAAFGARINRMIAHNTPPAERLIVSDKNPALWQDLLIPEHLMVRNYQLYRGDGRLIGNAISEQALFESGSVFWQNIHRLFSKGSFVALEGVDQYPHRDVYHHSIDNGFSSFLSSSKDFFTAARFGKLSGTPWSAIIEFEGSGVDVVKTAKYFEKLAFLGLSKSFFPDEKEVSISHGIHAENIKGVWLVRAGVGLYFIENPNFLN